MAYLAQKPCTNDKKKQAAHKAQPVFGSLYTKPLSGHPCGGYCLGGDHGQGGFMLTVYKPHLAVRTTAPVSVI
jgi:hypothetical protein